MQVDATSLLSAQLKAAQSGASNAMYSGSFLDALNAAKKNAANTVQPPVQQQVKSADDAAYQALLQYMKESPAEHLREKIMAEMGLSDASLAAMPPAQRAAAEAAIAKKITEYMLTHNQAPPQPQSQSADASKMTLLPS